MINVVWSLSLKKSPVSKGLNELCLDSLGYRSITNPQKPPLKWDKEKIKKYHLQAVTIAQALGGENSYLDNRIRDKIKAYTAFV